MSDAGRASPRYLRAILLIHGVDYDQKWFATAKSILEPHFVCLELRYPEYDRMGIPRILFDLRPRSLVKCLLIAAIFASVLGHYWLSAVSAIIIGAIICLLLLWIHARRLRASTVAEIEKTCSQVTPFGQRANVLAHSFGTYVFGKFISRFANEFDRVALAGCVLKRKFDWSSVFEGTRPQVIEVRNDVAPRDRLVSAARFALLGNAGQAGFSGPSNLIHSPRLRPCEKCSSERTQAPVHNLTFPGFDHSDMFVGTSHIAGEYLPFFFGIEPEEYRHFVGLCRDAAIAFSVPNHSEVNRLERTLAKTPWRWAHGTLEEYILRQLKVLTTKAVFVVDSNKLAVITRLVWKTVDAACEARGDQTRSALVLKMRPEIAVGSAISALP